MVIAKNGGSCEPLSPLQAELPYRGTTPLLDFGSDLGKANHHGKTSDHAIESYIGIAIEPSQTKLF